MDLNNAIDVYSHSFGNRLEPLRALCGDDELAEKLANEIVAVQKAIIDLVHAGAGYDGLTANAIEQIGREYVNSTSLQINEVGLQAIMRYVIWYSWHEGYLGR